MAYLDITLADGRKRTHQLGEQPVVLGREPTCDIPLQDLSASRRHVIIRRDTDQYILEDLGSKNGTLVNDLPAQTVALRSGDEIMIGAVRAIFRDQPPPSVGLSVVVADQPRGQQSTTYRGEIESPNLSHRRLELLYQLNERLTRVRDRDELLSDAMDVCFEMLRFERGAMAIKQPKGNLVDWPVVRNLRGAEGELTVSRTILSSALTHGERVIVNDTGAANIDPTISMVQHGIRSAMCVPLMSNERILGVIYGDRVSTGTTYTKEEIDFLAGIARLVTIGLINAQLLEEQKLKIQLEGEIAMARDIQTGLFPRRIPNRDDLRFAAINDPGRHVSGDYYDIVELPDRRVLFLIADVTGEGVAASLLMANLQAAVRVTLGDSQPLGRLLDRWSSLIYQNTDASKFVTCLVGIIDPAGRRLELASAGHHHPIAVRAGNCTTFEIESEYPLGVIEQSEYASHFFDLEPGPLSILCYTDGVIEAMDEDMELFGMNRLHEALASAEGIDAESLVRRVRQGVRKFVGNQPQGDDITILAIHLP